MPAPQVAVVGMRALRRDINRLAEEPRSELYAGIKAAGRAAAQPVAAATRARLPRGPRTSGRLQEDVRISATKTGATVRMGRATVPWAGWVEFGGGRPDGSSRDYVAGGRYMFPAAQGLAGRSADEYSKALTAVFASAGVWTNTSSEGASIHD